MSTRKHDEPTPVQAPDLQTQFESLLNEVWALEAEWALDDRIDMALKVRRTAGQRRL